MKPSRAHRESALGPQTYVADLPDRSVLLAFLAQCSVPVTFDRIADTHALRTLAARTALQRRLKAMERDGQIIRNRGGDFGLVERMDLITGRVIGHRDGFGFVRPDDAGTDLFFSPRRMRSLMHGDRVIARVVKVDSNGRREGDLVEIIERGVERIVGRLCRESGVTFVRPYNVRIHQDVLIPADATPGADDGDYVVVRITEQPTKRHPPIGIVEETLGDQLQPGMGVDVTIRAHDLPISWPEDVRLEAAALPSEVGPVDLMGRKDLRGFDFVTIDGEDAHDFDDAVYCERTAKGWRLVVAIADVSAYIHPATALDAQARLRGNSIYFPDRVIPMLPESISNQLCSLRPDEDRLCMGCELIVTELGRVHRSRFFEGVMRSRARLTYTEVSGLLEGDEFPAREQLRKVAPMIETLRDVYASLRRARDERGAIDFDMNEIRIVLESDGRVVRLEPTVRNIAHRIIEECMVAANVAAARLLEHHRLPTLFRVHESPSPDRVDELRAFLAEFGLKLAGGDMIEPRHFAAVIESAASRPDAHLIHTVMLRSLSQAMYTPGNAGHFGLAHRAYVHFTSPIRRYPDLIVHRAIRHVLHRGRPGDFAPTRESLTMLGGHCSMTERRADDATRDAIAWFKCEFMCDRLGEVFNSTITGVTDFGVFVTLDDVYVEGLVHISTLGHDYFHFDPIRHRLSGKRSRHVFRLSDQLKVRVTRVDLDERRIDFEPADRPSATQGVARSKRGSGGRR